MPRSKRAKQPLFLGEREPRLQFHLFKECTQLSVACGRKIEKRFKRSEIKEIAPPVTHKTCLIDILAAPVILTGKNSGL